MDTHLFLAALPVFALMIMAEAIYARLQGKSVYDTKETLSTVVIQLVHQFTVILTAAVLAPVSVSVYQHRLFEVPVNWMTAIVSLILMDFLYYWFHRVSHQNQ